MNINIAEDTGAGEPDAGHWGLFSNFVPFTKSLWQNLNAFFVWAENFCLPNVSLLSFHYSLSNTQLIL